MVFRDTCMLPSFKLMKQIIASIIALSPFLLDGINDGYSSNILHQEKTRTIDFKITDSDLSWIASINIISMPIGSLCCGHLMYTYGRKKILQLLCLLGIFGWLIIFEADSVTAACIGRLLNGLAVGMQITSIMYISEISDTPKFRAFLLSLMNPTIGLGTAISFVAGYVFTAELYSATMSSIALIFFLLTFIIPESPVWLKQKNDYKGAAKSLKWLDRKDIHIKESIEDFHQHSATGLKLSLVTRIIISKAWKPFIHLTIFFFLQVVTGNPVCIYYAANIYESLHIPLDSSLSAVILAAAQFVTLIGVSCTIDKLDRRTWTKISSIGICISYLIMAIYEHISLTMETNAFFWETLILSWIGGIFNAIGLYSIPWILLGELFPATVKDFMGGLQLMVIYIIQFLSIKSYPILEPVIKIDGICMIFSVGGLLSFLYSQFLMPETRGKTLTEIEKFWL